MDSIEKVIKFFAISKPTPTPQDVMSQIAVHIEEFQEMLEALGWGRNEDLSYHLDTLQGYYKAKAQSEELSITEMADFDKVLLLDSLQDQTVTSQGIGYMMGFDMVGSLTEVANSNLSKFGSRYCSLTTEHVTVLNNNCKDIESEGRYVGVRWERVGNYIVYFDNTGKILKNPHTFFQPNLEEYI